MRTTGWMQFVKKNEVDVGCAVVIKATGQRGIVTYADWSMLVNVLLEGFDVATFRRDEVALLGANRWGTDFEELA
jgi:hypothetical protein